MQCGKEIRQVADELGYANKGLWFRAKLQSKQQILKRVYPEFKLPHMHINYGCNKQNHDEESDRN